MRNLILLSILLFSCLTSCNKDDEQTTPTSQTGGVAFWTPNLAAHGGYVNITINGLTRTITTNWATPPPSCSSTNGVAYFNLNAGTYNYSTVDFFGFTSNGTVTFVANDCNKQRIE